MSSRTRRYRRTPRKGKTSASTVPKIEVPRRDNMGLIYRLTPFCFLGGVLFFASLNHYFILDLMDYAKLFFCTYLFLLAIPIKFYRKYLTISFYEFFILNLVSVTPLLLMLIFSLNYFIQIDETTETFPVEKVRYNQKYMKRIVTLKNYKHADFEAFRTIYDWNSFSNRSHNEYVIRYTTGVFGIKMYQHQILK